MTSMKYTTFEALELEVESLRQQLADMTKERDKAKAMPMKYRRMEFNAQLQNENESLRQRLAAALAACELKDEALEGLIDTMDLRLDDDDLSLETRTAFEALAIQPDDSALKECLAEPVGWTHSCPILCLDGVELWINKCPHCGKPAPKGLNHGN